MNKKIITGIIGASALLVGVNVPLENSPVTVNEWQAITTMYNEEIALAGGKITVKDYNGDIKQINDVIRARPPKNKAEGDERERLMEKTEKRTVLEAIIK